MNDVERLIRRLAELDVRVSLNGDRLSIDAPMGVLTLELREAIAQVRAQCAADFLGPRARAHTFPDRPSRVDVPRRPPT